MSLLMPTDPINLNKKIITATGVSSNSCETLRRLFSLDGRRKEETGGGGGRRERYNRSRMYSPQNRTTDAGDARRVRRRCTPDRFLLAGRSAHLPHLARGRERDPLENRLLIRDVRDGGDRAIRTRRGRRRPRRRRARRLIARQGRRGTHCAVTSVSSTWKGTMLDWEPPNLTIRHF